MEKESNKLMKLIEINNLLTKSLDLSSILKTLVDSAFELVEAADTIILALYNEEKKVLEIVEGIGIDKEQMKNVKLLPGESLTGKTFEAKKSMLFSNKDEIERAMSTMSINNAHHYLKGVYEKQLKSSFCVPLLYREKCLGVLIVDSFKDQNYFTEEDMMIIEVIAHQSAITITNSKQVDHLKEKNKLLLMSTDIHHKFTNLVLEGRGEKCILEFLGRYLKCRIEFKHTETTQDGYSSFPIIKENETLGFIHYEKHFESLTPMETAALEHAATALALNMLKENALYEKELLLREEFFQEIVEGIPELELMKLANQVNWKTDWQFICMILEGKKKPLWDPKKIISKRNFIKSIENMCQSVCENSFIFTKGIQLIIIFPSLPEKTIQKIVSMVNKQLNNKENILYGIGRETKLNNIGESFKEAKDAIRNSRLKGDQVTFYSKLGAERLWQNVDPFTLENFIKDHFGQLLTMAEDYIHTLFTLIELNKNHKKTAKTLHIHPNTLYYRLKKIEEILNVSFDDSHDWLNLTLAYQIYCAMQQEKTPNFKPRHIVR